MIYLTVYKLLLHVLFISLCMLQHNLTRYSSTHTHQQLLVTMGNQPYEREKTSNTFHTGHNDCAELLARKTIITIWATTGVQNSEVLDF